MQVAIASRYSRIINRAVSTRVDRVVHSVLKPPCVRFTPNLSPGVTGARTLSTTSRSWIAVRTAPSAVRINAFLSDFPSRPPQNAGINGDRSSPPNWYTLYSTEAAPRPKQEKRTPLTKTEAAGENVAQAQIIATLAKYLWMKDNSEFRLRVLAALGLLIGAKVINVQVPFLFKLAVDWLATASGNAGALAEFAAANSTSIALFVSPAAVLIGYGIARMGASAFNEIRTAIFSKVALRTIRQVSRKISMVSGILAYKFGATFAWITMLSMTGYIAFTLTVTQWRTKFRKTMNKADNDANTRAIDSLINYETVKYFNNEAFEADRYDEFLEIKILTLIDQ